MDTIHGEVHKALSENFKRAFMDLLAERIAGDPPDYEWITRLYQEIKIKLMRLLRTEHPLRLEIEETMDIQLFEQMIRNQAFDPHDLYKLVSYVFEKCKQLGAPARDASVDAKKLELLTHMQSGEATFKTVVPMFIQRANDCLDQIYQDINNLQSKLK